MFFVLVISSYPSGFGCRSVESNNACRLTDKVVKLLALMHELQTRLLNFVMHFEVQKELVQQTGTAQNDEFFRHQQSVQGFCTDSRIAMDEVIVGNDYRYSE